MAKEDAIGMGPDGKIQQYKKGEKIPPKPIRIVGEDGSQEFKFIDDEDPFLEDDSDLGLEDDDE